MLDGTGRAASRHQSGVSSRVALCGEAASGLVAERAAPKATWHWGGLSPGQAARKRNLTGQGRSPTEKCPERVMACEIGDRFRSRLQCPAATHRKDAHMRGKLRDKSSAWMSSRGRRDSPSPPGPKGSRRISRVKREKKKKTAATSALVAKSICHTPAGKTMPVNLKRDAPPPQKQDKDTQSLKIGSCLDLSPPACQRS